MNANWFGQVTTGHGAMALAGTVLACLSGQMTWAAATPLLVVGLVGLLWPENAAAAATAQKIGLDAQPVVSDVEAALRALLTRAMKPVQTAPALNTAAPGATAGTISMRVAILLAAFALAISYAVTPFAVILLLKIAIVAVVIGLLMWMLLVSGRRMVMGTCLLLAACSGAQVSGVLQDNGVSAKTADKMGAVWSTAVDDGTLFCKINGIVAAVPGVNVINAQAAPVATACAGAALIGAAVAAVVPVPPSGVPVVSVPVVSIPVPPPATPAAVPIAVVPAAAAIAVETSKS